MMSAPRYEPHGWVQWPDHPFWSYQFRRGLGETQEGGGAVSECLQAASRMRPGDDESWHAEWTVVAERNRLRAEAAEVAGHFVTARNAFLRATDYYRSAEFWLAGTDPRRLETFTKCEDCFRRAGKYFTPPMEVVEILYGGTTLPGYFLRPAEVKTRWPVLIAFGGLDSFKEELYFMVARGALERGIACLLVDGPGQGATLRRKGIHTRYDYEVPVGACIDYLETRRDVDPSRIAVSGSSLGGYYAARAAAFERRLAACISHGAQWSVAASWREQKRDDNHPLARHIRWVFGANTMAEATRLAEPFTLEGVIGQIRCPYLIIHGGHDFLGVKRASQVHEAAEAAGVEVTLIVVTAEETGAEHCQHDNPTLGEEYMFDWLSDVLVRRPG